MFFNNYNLASPLSELAMPESFLDDEMMPAAELALPHNSPYSAGFCEASPLPTAGPTLGYDPSSTLTWSHIPLGSEVQQGMRSMYPSAFDAAEQSREMSFQGERRLSDSSGTTDSAEDSLNDLHEMNHSLPLESPDAGAPRNSSFNRLIDAWKGVQRSPETGAFVPQKLYQPRGETDRVKYVYTANLHPPILFYAKNPSELGIPLEEILKTSSRRLNDSDDLVLEGCGRSISVRIEWPGYHSWKGQLPTRNCCKTPGPITRGRLAKNLASCVHKFIEEKTACRMEIDANPAWRIGHRRIKYEDLILVSLHHVSRGSWQPQLRLRLQKQVTSIRAL